MPMPRWWARMNKRVFNPRALAGAKWPVLIHTGRRTGAIHRTPLDVYPADGGYVFVPVYGAQSDWVRNILAAGHARLRIDGGEVELTGPRMIGRDEAFGILSAAEARTPRVLGITEYLRMDSVADR